MLRNPTLQALRNGIAPAPIERGTIIVRDAYMVDLNNRQSAYDTGDIAAYSATSKEEKGKSWLAYLCPMHSMPRFRQLHLLRQQKVSHLLRPLCWQMTLIEQKPVLVIIADFPRGQPLLKPGEQLPRKMNERELMEKLLRPAARMLFELEKAGSCHRNIHPHNLYWADDNQQSLFFGESFCAPPGALQPLLYETWNSSLAHPLGRSEGNIRNDMYALGITFLSLLTGRDYSSASPENLAFQQERLENNSYLTFTLPLRLSTMASEVLRGLLEDNAHHRWSPVDLEVWLGNQKIPQRNHQNIRKAARGYPYAGQNYASARSLAAAVGGKWQNVTETLTDAALESWLKRLLGRDQIQQELQETLLACRGLDNSIQNNMIGSYILVLLDPEQPLHYKGKSICWDALGTWLACHFQEGTARGHAADIIKARLPSWWQRRQKSDYEGGRQMKQLEKLPASLLKSGPGHGIERCLYELNPGIPCQGNWLQGYLVTRIEDVLPALECIAEPRIPDGLPVDRHIASFLAASGNFITEEMLVMLGQSEQPGKPPLASLRILAMLAAKTGQDNWPALCRWLHRLLEPTVKSYFNLDRQKRIGEALEKAAGKGSLQMMLTVADNQKEWKTDMEEYLAANATYQQLCTEKEEIVKQEQAIQEKVRTISRQLCPYVSMAVASTIAALMVALS